jgi:LysM repeat protein
MAARDEIARRDRQSDRLVQQRVPATVQQHQRVDDTGARYRRVVGPRRTRPVSGTVAHRNRVTVGPCPPGSASGGYRMGRWARLAMTVVVVSAVVVATLTLVLRPTSVPTRFITVQPGDTLASIAVSALPGLDRADAIAVVESLNGLDAPTVQVGAVLRVPAGDGHR